MHVCRVARGLVCDIAVLGIAVCFLYKASQKRDEGWQAPLDPGPLAPLDPGPLAPLDPGQSQTLDTACLSSLEKC